MERLNSKPPLQTNPKPTGDRHENFSSMLFHLAVLGGSSGLELLRQVGLVIDWSRGAGAKGSSRSESGWRLRARNRFGSKQSRSGFYNQHGNFWRQRGRRVDFF